MWCCFLDAQLAMFNNCRRSMISETRNLLCRYRPPSFRLWFFWMLSSYGFQVFVVLVRDGREINLLLKGGVTEKWCRIQHDEYNLHFSSPQLSSSAKRYEGSFGWYCTIWLSLYTARSDSELFFSCLPSNPDTFTNINTKVISAENCLARSAIHA